MLRSHFYNNPNNYELIEHIYGKLKGYDFSYTSKSGTNERGARCFWFERVETPNGHVMDLNTLKIEFVNNSLIISDSKVSYKYDVDEHCIIYLNGENLHIAQKILTEDEIKYSQQKLYDDMKSLRKRHERDMLSSYEFSKEYHVR